MKYGIKIKSFRGVPVVSAFFPRSGVKICKNDEFWFNDDEEELFKKCLATDMVEALIPDEPVKRVGRPRKNEETESG